MSDIVQSVFFNSFWISGLALLLAALSYHYDRAQRASRPLREQLSATSFALAGWSALTLIGIGLAGTSASLWEIIVWTAFSCYALISALTRWRTARQKRLLEAPKTNFEHE